MGGRALARGGPHVYTYTSRAQASKAHYRSKRYDAHACVGKRHNLGVASWAGGAARTLHGTRGRSRRWLVRPAARLQRLTRLENQLHISRSARGAWEGRLMISFSFFFFFFFQGRHGVKARRCTSPAGKGTGPQRPGARTLAVVSCVCRGAGRSNQLKAAGLSEVPA